MKIKRVDCNNRKKAFEVLIRGGDYLFPYAKLKVKPSLSAAKKMPTITATSLSLICHRWWLSRNGSTTSRQVCRNYPTQYGRVMPKSWVLEKKTLNAW